VSSTELAAEFAFGGSAPRAHRSVDTYGDGLRIGVRPHETGVWEGAYAVSHATFPETAVFHVRMTRDGAEVPRTDQSGEAVFAVQTSSTAETGALNYVVAASTTNDGSTCWVVGNAEGVDCDAELTVLWKGLVSTTAAADLAQEITLRTDGQTSLEVWFGPRLVYASEDLSLDIRPPFQSYLEVQALEIGYSATFTDYWVSKDASIIVQGLRPDERVCFVQADGHRCDSVASATGEARLVLRMPVVRGRGSLNLFERPDPVVFGPFNYAGGDGYRIMAEDDAGG
jgi:hypothetical protein